MSMSIHIEPRATHLHVTLNGEFVLEEAQDSFTEVAQAIARHDVKKVLIDGQQVTGELTVMERFLYGEFVADVCERIRRVPMGHFPQLAYVLRPPVLDPERFGETVARNRGLNVKTFQELVFARRWLDIDNEN